MIKKDPNRGLQVCQVQINRDLEDLGQTKVLDPISMDLEVQGHTKALEVPGHNSKALEGLILFNKALEGQVLINKAIDPQLQINMDRGDLLLNSRVLIKVKMKWVQEDLICTAQEGLV